MKRSLIALIILMALWSCKNKDAENQKEQLLKNLRAQDSLMGLKTQAEDSTITAYIQAFNEVQDNLDSIKMRQRIISRVSKNGESGDKKSLIIDDMKDIESIMNKNREEVANMELKLKLSGMKNAALEKMIAHLTEELTDKDVEITALQSRLAELSANLREVMESLNDSMQVIQQKNSVIAEQNTIYYAVGTSKELKKKGVIRKKGGVVGIGGTEELKSNTNKKYFTTADMYNLQAIPLYGKLDKIITTHPTSSYAVRGDERADSLIITDQKEFWSESKYLVITVKQHP